MDKLLEILTGVKDSVDYENESALWDDGLIDSLDLMEIISELEDAYDIEIGMDDIIPENFNTAAAMLALVEKLQG